MEGWRDGDEPILSPLPMHPDESVPPALYQVNLPHSDQLIGSNASVSQQANDNLVSLETRDPLQFVYLMAAKHIQYPPRKLGRLRTHVADLPLATAPAEEQVDVAHVGVDREP
jgi:hypothetical protein